MADAPFASPPAQLSAGHPVLGTDPTTHGSTPLMTGYNTPAQLQQYFIWASALRGPV